MSAREIATMITEMLQAEREKFLELLEGEDYEEIEDEIFYFLTEE